MMDMMDILKNLGSDVLSFLDGDFDLTTAHPKDIPGLAGSPDSDSRLIISQETSSKKRPTTEPSTNPSDSPADKRGKKAAKEAETQLPGVLQEQPEQTTEQQQKPDKQNSNVCSYKIVIASVRPFLTPDDSVAAEAALAKYIKDKDSARNGAYLEKKKLGKNFGDIVSSFIRIDEKKFLIRYFFPKEAEELLEWIKKNKSAKSNGWEAMAKLMTLVLRQLVTKEEAKSFIPINGKLYQRTKAFDDALEAACASWPSRTQQQQASVPPAGDEPTPDAPRHESLLVAKDSALIWQPPVGELAAGEEKHMSVPLEAGGKEGSSSTRSDQMTGSVHRSDATSDGASSSTLILRPDEPSQDFWTGIWLDSLFTSVYASGATGEGASLSTPMRRPDDLSDDIWIDNGFASLFTLVNAGHMPGAGVPQCNSSANFCAGSMPDSSSSQFPDIWVSS